MAYKRHGRGGRYKGQSVGDLGLRAKREKDQLVIDGLKLQQKRTEEYGNATLRAEKEAARSEADNRETLQQLENKFWQNRQKAIKVRADNEIDKIKGKAEEHRKWAEFWGNVTPNLAKTVQATSKGLMDYAGQKQASEWFNSVEGQNSLQNALELFREGTNSTLNMTHKEMWTALRNADYEQFKGLFNTVHWNAKRFAIGKVENWLLQNRETIYSEVKRTTQGTDAEWKLNGANDVRNFTNFLIKSQGLDPNHPKFSDLHSKFNALYNEDRIERDHIARSKARNDKFEEIAKSLSTYSDEDKIKSGYDALIVAYAQAPIRTDSNTYKDLGGINQFNHRDAREGIIAIMIDDGHWNVEQALKFYDSTTPKQFQGKTRDEIKELAQERHSVATIKRAELETKQQLSEAIVATSDINARFTDRTRSDYININTEEGWDQAVSLLNNNTYKVFDTFASGTNSNVACALCAVRRNLGLKPGSTDTTSTEIGFIRALNNNDKHAVDAYWVNLNDTQKAFYKDRYQDYDILVQGGGTSKELNALTGSLLKRINKQSSTFDIDSTQSLQIKDVINQRFHYNFNKLKREDYDKMGAGWEKRMVQDAWNKTQEQVLNGEGIFKRESIRDKKAGSGRIVTWD